jgi:hypothetical protein
MMTFRNLEVDQLVCTPHTPDEGGYIDSRFGRLFPMEKRSFPPT